MYSGRMLLALTLIAAAPCFGDPAEADEQAMSDVAKKIVVQGEVCPHPERPCLEGDAFKPNELSFKLDRAFAFDRGQDRSRPFYAVILRSAALCSISEEERLRIQEHFPDRKVFVHRHLCEDFNDNVTYTNVNRETGFIAVYAGRTRSEVDELLFDVKDAGAFPGANLRRMEVVLVWQLE